MTVPNDSVAISTGIRVEFPTTVIIQMEDLPIGSGPVESLVKQIDARLQLVGVQWNTESLPQMLKLRCAYLNEQLDVISSVRG